MKILSYILFVLVLFFNKVHATTLQDSTLSAKVDADLRSFGEKVKLSEPERRNTLANQLTSGDSLLIAYDKAYVMYQFEVLNINKRAFNWQHTSSFLIFLLSLAITKFGLIFSAIHFYMSYKNVQKIEQGTKDREVIKLDDSNATSIEVSSTGLKMSSSILGVIILVISLLFFFMYIKFVYPINKI